MADRLIQETFTELAPRYETVVDGELQRFWGWRYDQFVNLIVENCKGFMGCVTLDIATGTAEIPLKIASCNGHHKRVMGLDITPAMLMRGKQKTQAKGFSEQIDLVCASAETIPYCDTSIDQVVCGLASHHIDIDLMLSEIYRVLRRDGCLVLGDVGASRLWKNPVVLFLLRVAAFCYFWVVENSKRAWAEAAAVSNVLTAEEWTACLLEKGFQKVEITRMASKYIWIPAPLIIKATKSFKEREDVKGC